MGSSLWQDTNERESWWVTNTTNKRLAIGDLIMLPAFGPGEKIDLLRYYPRERISQSENLKTLIDIGWLALDKPKHWDDGFGY